MPKGPNGQKRPADAIGLAVMIGKIATGEIEEDVRQDTQLHRAGGKMGGTARAKALTAKQRAEISSIAAQARWKKAD